MDDAIKSPLINGKPAWHVHRRRYFIRLMLVLSPAIFIMTVVFDSNDLLNFPSWVSVATSLGMGLVGIFFLDVRMKRFGLSAFQSNATLLEKIDGVPCPSCLYPLCELPEADQVYVCSECGCGIRGSDAIRAWDGLRGYRSPQAWKRWLKED